MDSVIFSVGHENVSVRVDGYALETLELSFALAPATEGAEERAVRVEDLDSVVAAVGHEDVALFVHGNAPERR